MREKLASAIEEFVVALVGGIVDLPRRAGEGLVEFGRLFAQSFDGAPGGQQAFENDLAGLVGPHLPVLVHKRTRIFVPSDEGARERWSLELHCFMDSKILPLMGTDRDYAERNRALVAALIDREIAREQGRITRSSLGNPEDLLPRVTRFESGWVM